MKKEIIFIFYILILTVIVPMVFARVHTLQIIARDSTRPDVNIIFPQNLTYNYSVNTINYAALDNSSVDYCWYSNDSGIHNYSVQNAGKNFTDVNSKDGSNTWRVYCNDSSGNIGESSVIFFVNLSHPINPIVYVNSCMDLNITGRTYILNKSLTVKGDCFKISAENISLDLNGKTVSGNLKGIGIESSGNRVIIKNGSIKGFLTGIKSAGNYSNFSDIYLEGNVLLMFFKDSTGVIINGNYNFLKNIKVYYNYLGINLKGNSNSLMNSEISSNIYGILGNGRGEIKTVKSCKNILLDFDCNGNYNGALNYLSKIDKCKNGWPGLNRDYNKCR
jgi:hypothetical protein